MLWGGPGLPGDGQRQPLDAWGKGASEPADAPSPGLPAAQRAPHRADRVLAEH